MNDESASPKIWGAWIRYYFHLDPEAMTDDELVARWSELKYCLTKLGILKK